MIAGTELMTDTVSIASMDSAFLHNHNQSLMEHEDLPQQLEGDQLRLQQILINLTKNGFKFAQGGKVRIYMAYSPIDELLRVHVKDNGRGIKKDDMHKLFNMFGKLRRTAAQNNDGIGMGLMISKNLIEINGGTISVHSDGEEEGSVFSFTMRMKLPKPNKKL